MSVVSVVCQEQVSATGRSRVQMSPSGCVRVRVCVTLVWSGAVITL